MIFSSKRPAGALTLTTCPFFLPKSAAPMGLSLEILLCIGSLSRAPTIVYSDSSSSVLSKYTHSGADIHPIGRHIAVVKNNRRADGVFKVDNLRFQA